MNSEELSYSIDAEMTTYGDSSNFSETQLELLEDIDYSNSEKYIEEFGDQVDEIVKSANDIKYDLLSASISSYEADLENLEKDVGWDDYYYNNWEIGRWLLDPNASFSDDKEYQTFLNFLIYIGLETNPNLKQSDFEKNVADGKYVAAMCEFTGGLSLQIVNLRNIDAALSIIAVHSDEKDIYSNEITKERNSADFQEYEYIMSGYVSQDIITNTDIYFNEYIDCATYLKIPLDELEINLNEAKNNGTLEVYLNSIYIEAYTKALDKYVDMDTLAPITLKKLISSTSELSLLQTFREGNSDYSDDINEIERDNDNYILEQVLQARIDYMDSTQGQYPLKNYLNIDPNYESVVTRENISYIYIHHYQNSLKNIQAAPRNIHGYDIYQDFYQALEVPLVSAQTQLDEDISRIKTLIKVMSNEKTITEIEDYINMSDYTEYTMTESEYENLVTNGSFPSSVELPALNDKGVVETIVGDYILEVSDPTDLEYYQVMTPEDVGIITYLYNKYPNQDYYLDYFNAKKEEFNSLIGLTYAMDFVEAMEKTDILNELTPEKIKDMTDAEFEALIEKIELDASLSNKAKSAFKGFALGLYSYKEGIYNIFYADGVISANQFQTMYIQYFLSSNSELETTFNVSNSVGNMIIPYVLSIAISVITAAASKNPKLAKIVGTTAFHALQFASSAGNKYELALQNDYSYNKAVMYSLISSGSETVTGIFLNGIPPFSLLGGVKGYKGFLVRKFSEGLEEGTQYLVDIYISACFGEELKVDYEELCKQGYYGFLTALVMPDNSLDSNKLEKYMNNADVMINLENMGLKFNYSDFFLNQEAYVGYMDFFSGLYLEIRNLDKSSKTKYINEINNIIESRGLSFFSDYGTDPKKAIDIILDAKAAGLEVDYDLINNDSYFKTLETKDEVKHQEYIDFKKEISNVVLNPVDVNNLLDAKFNYNLEIDLDKLQKEGYVGGLLTVNSQTKAKIYNAIKNSENSEINNMIYDSEKLNKVLGAVSKSQSYMEQYGGIDYDNLNDATYINNLYLIHNDSRAGIYNTIANSENESVRNILIDTEKLKSVFEAVEIADQYLKNYSGVDYTKLDQENYLETLKLITSEKRAEIYNTIVNSENESVRSILNNLDSLETVFKAVDNDLDIDIDLLSYPNYIECLGMVYTESQKKGFKKLMDALNPHSYSWWNPNNVTNLFRPPNSTKPTKADVEYLMNNPSLFRKVLYAESNGLEVDYKKIKNLEYQETLGLFSSTFDVNLYKSIKEYDVENIPGISNIEEITENPETLNVILNANRLNVELDYSKFGDPEYISELSKVDTQEKAIIYNALVSSNENIDKVSALKFVNNSQNLTELYNLVMAGSDLLSIQYISETYNIEVDQQKQSSTNYVEGLKTISSSADAEVYKKVKENCNIRLLYHPEILKILMKANSLGIEINYTYLKNFRQSYNYTIILKEICEDGNIDVYNNIKNSGVTGIEEVLDDVWLLKDIITAHNNGANIDYSKLTDLNYIGLLRMLNNSDRVEIYNNMLLHNPDFMYSNLDIVKHFFANDSIDLRSIIESGETYASNGYSNIPAEKAILEFNYGENVANAYEILVYKNDKESATEVIQSLSLDDIAHLYLVLLNNTSALNLFGEVISNTSTLNGYQIHGDPAKSNFGCNQAAVGALCDYIYEGPDITVTDSDGKTFTLKNGQTYSYIYARHLHKVCQVEFVRVETSEYTRLKQKLMNQGFSEADAVTIMCTVDDTGACSYAAAANVIFSSFTGKEAEFEQKFGYPMYRIENGQKVLNSAELLLDLYVFANDTQNGGKFILPDKTLNPNLINQDQTDFDGNYMLDSSRQIYLGKDWTIESNFLKSKGNYNYICEYSFNYAISNFSDSEFEASIFTVKSALSLGKKGLLSLAPATASNPINMYSTNPSSYSSTSTATWGESGAHAVFITDVGPDCFYVSSWGQEYTIPFSDLKNGVTIRLVSIN